MSVLCYIFFLSILTFNSVACQLLPEKYNIHFWNTIYDLWIPNINIIDRFDQYTCLWIRLVTTQVTSTRYTTITHKYFEIKDQNNHQRLVTIERSMSLPVRQPLSFYEVYTLWTMDSITFWKESKGVIKYKPACRDISSMYAIRTRVQ